MSTEFTEETILEKLGEAWGQRAIAQARVRNLLSDYTALHYDPSNPFAHLLAYLRKRSEIDGDAYDFDEHDYTITERSDLVSIEDANTPRPLMLAFGGATEKTALKVCPPEGRHREHVPPEEWDWEVVDPCITRADDRACRHFGKEYIYDLFEQWWLSQI